MHTARLTWVSFLIERRIDDIGYWKYLQTLDPRVSEIKVICFTQAHSYAPFTFLFNERSDGGWVFPAWSLAHLEISTASISLVTVNQWGPS